MNRQAFHWYCAMMQLSIEAIPEHDRTEYHKYPWSYVDEMEWSERRKWKVWKGRKELAVKY